MVDVHTMTFVFLFADRACVLLLVVIHFRGNCIRTLCLTVFVMRHGEVCVHAPENGFVERVAPEQAGSKESWCEINICMPRHRNT